MPLFCRIIAMPVRSFESSSVIGDPYAFYPFLREPVDQFPSGLTYLAGQKLPSGSSTFSWSSSCSSSGSSSGDVAQTSFSTVPIASSVTVSERTPSVPSLPLEIQDSLLHFKLIDAFLASGTISPLKLYLSNLFRDRPLSYLDAFFSLLEFMNPRISNLNATSDLFQYFYGHLLKFCFVNLAYTPFMKGRSYSDFPYLSLERCGFFNQFFCFRERLPLNLGGKPRISHLSLGGEGGGASLILKDSILLGSGSYGVVKKFGDFAIKKIPFTMPISYFEIAYEFFLARYLQPHPHLMGILDSYAYLDGKKKMGTLSDGRLSSPLGMQSKVAFVMPCADGNAGTYFSTVSLDQSLFLFNGALLGLLHMHQSGLCHNDFKLENILIMNASVDAAVKKTVLTDFGISFPLDPSLFSFLTWPKLGGSFPSPEALFARQTHTPGLDRSKIDSFAVGVNLLRLFRGKLFDSIPIPYYRVNPSDTRDYPQNPVRVFLCEVATFSKTVKSSACSDMIKDITALAVRCLDEDPTLRPTVSEIVDEVSCILKSC